MESPPASAQKSDTSFKDVVDLGIAIARVKGLDATNAEIRRSYQPTGLFFAETNGNQNAGNARSNKYKGSFQTGPSEDQNGQKKWAVMKKSIAAFDPALSLRDDREEERVGSLDHRLNHWTAVEVLSRRPMVDRPSMPSSIRLPFVILLRAIGFMARMCVLSCSIILVYRANQPADHARSSLFHRCQGMGAKEKQPEGGCVFKANDDDEAIRRPSMPASTCGDRP